MLALGLLLATITAVQGQQTGSISGNVAIEKGGPRHVVVLLFKVDVSAMDRKALATATTDDEGDYRFEGLAAGEYVVSPSALGYVGPREWTYGYNGKQVSLGGGESVEDVDLNLARGGVVTGRVTDSDGRPVVNETVYLTLVAEDGSRKPAMLPSRVQRETDDRGMYRFYGVAEGRYLVSVGAGESERAGVYRFGQAGWYPKSFHPSSPTEGGATAVAVSSSAEARDVDIVVGRRARSYRAKGRVVDAESGKPIANARVGYGNVINGQMGGATIISKSDARGEFTLDALTPGKYAAFVSGSDEEGWSWYGDAAPFEISGADVNNVEIAMRRGGHVDGVVVLEGTNDPAIKSKLSAMYVSSWTQTEDKPAVVGIGGGSTSKIGPDGAFRLSSVRPGQVMLNVSSWPRQKGFSLIRIEREGVAVTGPIDVALGESVTGLRVVLGYGTGVIRGQIEVVGYQPPDARLGLEVRRAGVRTVDTWASVDERGRFIVDGLPAGDYELTASIYGENVRKSAAKSVSVTNDSEVAVTIQLDTNNGDGGSEQ